MHNLEIINAECKDISSLIKDKWTYRLKKALVTVVASIIIALGAYQTVSAQSYPETKNIVQNISDAMQSKEFNNMTPEQQVETIIRWITALTDQITTQFSDHLKKKRFDQAAKDLSFYESIAKDIKDTNIVALIKKLRNDLDTQKRLYDQMNKNVYDQIKHNKEHTGLIQYVSGYKYATFSQTSKDMQIAVDKAEQDLIKYIKNNNLKTEDTQIARKVEKQGNIFIATAYIMIN